MHCGQKSISNKKSSTTNSTSGSKNRRLLDSGLQRSSSTNNRRSPLPFRLLRSLSGTATDPRQLWTSNGVDTQILRLFNFDGRNYNLRFAVSGKILRLGHSRLDDTGTIDKDLRVCGRTFYDADANEITIAIEDLASVEADASKLTAPIRFRAEMESSIRTAQRCNANDGDDDRLAAELRLRKSVAARDQVSFDRFVSLVRMKSVFGRLSAVRSVSFDFRLDVLAMSTTFEASPLVDPLPTVIPTALARGLADPVGNVFLHCQPKSGYVTVDELKRLLFILDSDPKAVSLPLVGVWTSGVETVRHPFVWTACARYVHADDRLDAVRSSPFLLVVYDRHTFRPRFYECAVTSLNETSTAAATSRISFPCASFVGRTSGVLSIADAGPPAASNDIVYSALLVRSNENLDNDDFKATDSEKSDVAVTPRQRLSFAASLDCNNLITETLTNDKGELDSPTRLTVSSPIPPEVMRFLEAQEQKLDDLRRRVDDLTREKTSLTNRSEASIAAAAVSKAVSSTATMTSFVFPPLSSKPLTMDSKGLQPDNLVEAENNNNYDDVSDPSIECLRGCDCPARMEHHHLTSCSSRTFSSSFENTLSDLKLDSMLSEPSAIDCQGQQPISPLQVDLPDYNPGSLLSYRHPESLAASFNLEDGRNPDQQLYGNLLKRIATILSNQSEDDEVERLTRKPDVRPSVFDSLFLPRLNYVSLRLGEKDEDDYERSAQFGALACKYLADLQSSDETELSLSTRRYLDKYRLQ